MEAFEATMTSNFFAFNVAVGLVSVVASGHLAQRMRPGFVRGASGFVLAAGIALFVAAAGTWLVAAFSSPAAAATSWRIPFRAVMWSLETGVEFAALGIVAGMLAYAVLRLRLGTKTRDEP
ncbi:hypothetical protein EN850_02930 [Mesorhizobium sp. M8A.F.Ca.ET.207.01.1.1]|uniref:hypothetical protein n=1 Tax=Mesorhizobium sp. M8A.F.Ca.ET.207.01.1.1 TaxID=2563968 RepID=UPI00109CB838|nr:hypothetical protein [Mesorhizobium sp. M8A.F.Ca.ET.207.01.1.1]TGQ83713.1 hypothetical protein EN850_02930 [Mesorhizobium sp. M8A.F.Ca.ET.207.01.1.1]